MESITYETLKRVQGDKKGITTQSPRGEGRPFIPPAKLGGILARFDKEIATPACRNIYLDKGFWMRKALRRAGTLPR
jgi:hypothetical protein